MVAYTQSTIRFKKYPFSPYLQRFLPPPPTSSMRLARFGCAGQHNGRFSAVMRRTSSLYCGDKIGLYSINPSKLSSPSSYRHAFVLQNARYFTTVFMCIKRPRHSFVVLFIISRYIDLFCSFLTIYSLF